MADGMTAAQAATLYDLDFFAWTQAQAAALRASPHADPSLDYENLAEEIESVGRSEAREVRPRVATIIEHLLKLEASPAGPPRAGWRITVARTRRDLHFVLSDSPSLRRRALESVAEEMASAAELVTTAMAAHGEDPTPVQARLTAGGYTAEQVLGAWWPDAPVPETRPAPPLP